MHTDEIEIRHDIEEPREDAQCPSEQSERQECLVMLTFTSKIGKQILKQCGNQWRVLKSQSTVLFSRHTGPWWFIEPVSGDDKFKDHNSRWMHRDNDQHLRWNCGGRAQRGSHTNDWLYFMSDEYLIIPDFLRRAELVAIDREKLCKKHTACPECETLQVQIISVGNQKWKCRHCKTTFHTDYKI